ncbi:MAG: hypothetical protein ABIT07_00765 [Ferruginibacter sp.]
MPSNIDARFFMSMSGGNMVDSAKTHADLAANKAAIANPVKSLRSE